MLLTMMSLVATAGRLPAALPPPPEEPRWLTLNPTRYFAGLEVEAERETRTPPNASTGTTVDRLFLAPTLGLVANGSIYHPNLFSFGLQGEGGYGWQSLSSNPGSSRQEETVLQRYDVTGLFLRNKPYAATVQADKVHTFRDANFFHRVTVDSQTYGGTVGYRTGPVPVILSARHLEEDQSDVNIHDTLDQSTLELHARNERRSRDSTDLFYSLVDYTRRTSSLYTDSGLAHYASLYDTERVGTQDRTQLNSALNYSELDSTNLPSKNFSASEDASIEHSKTLTSFYDYSFNHNATDPASSDSHFGRVALQHQLYESLTTLVDVHASDITTDSRFGSQDQFRYGGGWSENYTKRLGDWGRLTIGNGVRLDQEHRQVQGTLLTIPSERHTLASGETFLNQPNVIEVLSVTDTNGVTLYRLGSDYETNYIGSLLQIKRLPTAPLLTNDSATIQVAYVVNLAPGQGSGSFETLGDQFSVRLDLFRGLLSIYSRLSWVENYGGKQFVLDDSFNTQSGADLAWHWLRSGGSYETRDSTFITYRAVNLYQSFFFTPIEASTLSLDLRQRWADYPEENRRVADYAFTARSHLRFSRHLFWLVEGGVRWEKGDRVDQQQAAARTELDFTAGKLKLLLGYQFNNDDIGGDLREKHFAYLRAKRSF